MGQGAEIDDHTHRRVAKGGDLEVKWLVEEAGYDESLVLGAAAAWRS
jgi:hypothetical protein